MLSLSHWASPSISPSRLREAARNHALTRLSRRKPNPKRARPAFKRLFALARTSLFLGLVSMSSACLVLSTPHYEEPDQTPPFLVAAAANPDLREFVLVLDEDTRKDFGAAVLSEDRGDPVHVALYIDYGVPNAAGHPFFRSIAEFPEVPAATMADGPRSVSAQWYLDTANVDPGCHTVTMMATHAFDYRNCPKVLSDSSQLVWKVLRCTTNDTCPVVDPIKDCPNSQQKALASCPAQTPEDQTASHEEGEL